MGNVSGAFKEMYCLCEAAVDFFLALSYVVWVMLVEHKEMFCLCETADVTRGFLRAERQNRRCNACYSRSAV